MSEGLSCLDDLVNQALFFMIKFVERQVEVFPQLTDLILESFEAILQEHVTSEVIAVDGRGKRGVSGLSGNLLLLHLSRGGIGHLVLVEVGVDEGVESLGENLVEAGLWVHVLKLLHIADLLADRKDLLGLVLTIEGISEGLDVLELLRPILLFEDDALLLAQVVHLLRYSRLDYALSLLKAAKQDVVST